MPEAINAKHQISDLLQVYLLRGLIRQSDYSQEGWNYQNYTIWGKDRDKSSGKRYSAVFTCPISGVHFPCGKLEKQQSVESDGAYWYSESLEFL